MTSCNLGIVFFPAYDWAISPTHPEREERLLYTQDQLREDGLFDLPGINEYRPQICSQEEVLKAHLCPRPLSEAAAAPHLISASGALSIGRRVLSGDCRKGFAMVRPPGHHAMRVIHGGRGFCNLNNEAIMVENLRREFNIKKVAIVDTDCHHGDGTQDIYWHDPDTLFISLHQDGRTLYPGTGFQDETGGPKAVGSTVNIPLPPRTGDDGFLLAARDIIRPILDDWGAELVVNSAGQDNHFSDPITNMNITAQGYGELSKIIDPDIAVLEGGYSVEGALPYVNLALCLSMAGFDFSQIREPDLKEKIRQSPPGVLDYIKRLGDEIFEIRKAARPEDSGSRKEGIFWVRERDIFYDTHAVDYKRGQKAAYNGYINESQREELYDCPNCPGLLIIKSRSEVCKSFTGLILPRNACEHCQQMAKEINADQIIR